MPKKGSQRAAFDQAAALEALIYAKGGVQLELPSVGARRFVGVVPAPDDKGEGDVGRPPGAQNAVPQAFRRYLKARYGSAIEGLAHEATRPTAALVAELVDAWQAVCAACGMPDVKPTSAQILGLVTMAKGLQVQAARFVAPYQDTQAPQAQPSAPPSVRIAVSMHTHGQPSQTVLVEAQQDLAGMLGIEENQRVIEHEPQELDAGELDERSADGA